MEEILKYFPGLTDRQKEQFAAMKGLYEEWNSKINVISRKDIDSFYLHHVLHSLALAKVAEGVFAQKGISILDVGTGGGFPGIPLAVLCPDIPFTLCDSIGKKTKVAEAVAASLGLENVTVVNARAESLPGQFDWIVSRAVTSLDNFMPWVKGKYTGGILYLKGGDMTEEIGKCAARRLLDPHKVTVSDISIFFTDSWFDEKKVVTITR
ncbi:MAG: 16S rRNA (guanine(527)-N(7))-methyltransferase RsmG [Bacteroidales bacterium]|nr:16S rRNA (guanine(527)-N(7))-methyltransferase RsmG [Candidatus Equibacterium intestinale]